MLNVAVLVSGGGTNLQALLDSEARGENPNGKITLVVASKPGVYALERAAKAGVEGVVVRRKDYENSEAFDAALLETLKSHNIDLVVLAGFLSVLGPSVIEAYPRRILNVHPALIPSFCGPGMYGLRPHQAALARGCKVTGATVHFVNEECDGGSSIRREVRAQGHDHRAEEEPEERDSTGNTDLCHVVEVDVVGMDDQDVGALQVEVVLGIDHPVRAPANAEERMVLDHRDRALPEGQAHLRRGVDLREDRGDALVEHRVEDEEDGDDEDAGDEQTS